jgi:hypothetical protein
MELITTPFIILCALVSIAFFIGMKVGEDNIKVKHMRDKLQDWKPHE